MIASTVVLAATYAVVISEKINRSIVALVGACVMVIAGLLTQDEYLAELQGLAISSALRPL